MVTWRRRGDDRPQPSARFRFQSDHPSIGQWSWTDNPFVGTRELNGLVAVNLLLNNWDLKTSNNRLYSTPPSAGEPARLARHHILRQILRQIVAGHTAPEKRRP